MDTKQSNNITNNNIANEQLPNQQVVQQPESVQPQVQNLQQQSYTQDTQQGVNKPDMTGYGFVNTKPEYETELKDLGMTKSSQYQRVDTSQYNSVGSDKVQAGVPTNSAQATQRSSVGPLSEGQLAIVAVRYGSNGISHVQLNDGQVLTVEEAFPLVEQKIIAGVHTGGSRGANPHKTLVSNPDGDSTNNLSNLPRF